MNLKHLRSTLCLLSVSALFVDGAIAQSGGAAAAKAKLASDYNAGRYRDVIADADMLKRAGALDAQAQLLIGQAYFKAGDYAGCVKYAKTLKSDNARELEARCAYEVAKAPQP
jgi:hypothetical protein